LRFLAAVGLASLDPPYVPHDRPPQSNPMKAVRPSDLELQVLTVLWDRGPSSVREVLEEMPDGKQRAYTTVLSVMQVMEKKGLVGHRREGQSYVYQAEVTRQQVLSPLMGDLLRNVFGGKASAALQFLLADADDDELREIRRLIDESTPRSSEGGIET
jgi:BlaI family penicillinase repressor